ncbi:hypothetical protein DVR12_21795 [Chitinophaga silvatica]|uniref:BZIP transcription factor n=1 Tax=Chitinophaga silvatica TaxID=2282649 RepID=A0A3E1Y4Y0_9BACT|nr:hypothetical protein [Chitinophaga silvatica]RFS19734.1 hypothetical protein DVR12_21795 [Chitinophaga silvatica]
MKKIIPVLALACLFSQFVNAQIEKFQKIGLGYAAPVPTNILHIIDSTTLIPSSSATYAVNINQSGVSLTMGADPNYSYIQSFNSKPLHINRVGNNTLINAYGGLVGVGTATPYFPFHIYTTVGGSGIGVQSTSALSVNSGGFIRLYNSGIPSAANLRLGGVVFGGNAPGTTNYYTGAQIEAVSSAAWTEGAAHPSALRFMTTGTTSGNPSERMRITEEGNVGINTTDTKGYKFAVNGNAIFSRVTVKNYASWPDYVFNSDYKLPSLESVSGFIQHHKHLPDMPSAAEVDNHGIDVGEMNARLLKKVEELTLYMIELNEQNKELRKEVQELKAKSN